MDEATFVWHMISPARMMLIANAGDCRAVLGKRGRAIELSIDHKPDYSSERQRIEKLGGVVYDGYLNGQLSVARALGDWHMKCPEGSSCPLSAEPELQEMLLSEEDEFLILGCDGLWDVMSSQCAVTIARKELMLHNDPERCSRELVREALKRNTCDNLTVVIVCFSPDPPPRLAIPKLQFKRCISAEGLDLLQEVLGSNVWLDWMLNRPIGIMYYDLTIACIWCCEVVAWKHLSRIYSAYVIRILLDEEILFHIETLCTVSPRCQKNIYLFTKIVVLNKILFILIDGSLGFSRLRPCQKHE